MVISLRVRDTAGNVHQENIDIGDNRVELMEVLLNAQYILYKCSPQVHALMAPVDEKEQKRLIRERVLAMAKDLIGDI